MKIKEDISKLKSVDVYSLILFTLYKMQNIPEYSSISELAYILDKDNLLKLCEYFGGTTIKIPTIEELETLVYSLVLYQYVNIDGMPFKQAVEIIGHKSSELRKVKSAYIKLCEVLNKYSFNRGSQNE